MSNKTGLDCRFSIHKVYAGKSQPVYQVFFAHKKVAESSTRNGALSKARQYNEKRVEGL